MGKIFCMLSLLLLGAWALIGCTSGGLPPAHGQIIVKVDKMNASDLIVRIGNGLDHPIGIRGRRTLSLKVVIGISSSQFTCQPLKTEGIERVLISGFATGGATESWITVSPQSWLVATVLTEVPQEFRGGDCTLGLLLKDGTESVLLTTFRVPEEGTEVH